MAVIRPLVIYSGPGGSPVTASYSGPEAATQSFKTNAPLIAVAGLLTEAAADGTSEGLVGISTGGATGVTSNEVGFVPWIPGMVIEGTLDDALSAGAAPLTHALVDADRFQLVNIVKDSTSGHWYFNDDATDDEKACILGFIDPIGTVCGRVRAVILGVADATGIVRGSLFT